MQKTYFSLYRNTLLLLVSVLFSAQVSRAQATYVPYSYQFDQKFDAQIYSVNTSFHTSLKPFIMDSVISGRYTQLMSVGVDSSYKGWVWRKLFNEH